jgi:lysophospholipase L1-like esterase
MEMVRKDRSKRLFTKLSEETSKQNIHSKRGIQLPIDKDNIVFVGNSITEGFPLAEIFNSIKIKNRGIGGDNSFDILYRIDELLNYQPKKLFLMIGINDIHQRLPENMTLTNIKQIIIKSKQTKTKVYIQSILPTSDSLINTIVQDYNQKIARIAINENIQFLNIYPKFIFHHRLKDNLTYDGLHLTTQGYLVWKSAIEQYVK